jgi:signal transduction histidine kinase
LSHELRTPMSAVLGWLHLLRSGKLKPEQEKQALETIERNAHLQNQLINDLLDVSRIITGQLRIERDRTLPSMILESAVESVGPQAAARRVSIKLVLSSIFLYSASSASCDNSRIYSPASSGICASEAVLIATPCFFKARISPSSIPSGAVSGQRR